MNEPVLLPLPQNPDVPSLHVKNGMLIARRPGEPDEVLPIGPAGAHAIGFYGLPTDVGSTDAEHGRSGWRILDQHGTSLWWLSNDTLPAYEPDQAREFAGAAGLVMVDLRQIGPATVSGKSERALGPGTSRIGRTVAPRREYAITLVAAAGVAIWGGFAWAVTGNTLASSLISIAGLFCGIFLAQFSALYLYGWRANRHYARQGPAVLRPKARMAGAVIAASNGDIAGYDYITQFGTGPAPQLTLYGSPTRAPHGLLVSWGNTCVDYRCPFDEAEVMAFAQAHGLQLNRQAEAVAQARPETSARLLTTARMRPFEPVAPLLIAALPICLAAGAAALLGVLPGVGLGLGLALVALPVNILGGLWLVRLQFSAALTRPQDVSPRG